MYNIIWDKPHNSVILTLEASSDVLSLSPRPVFFEELNNLGLQKHWTYPECKEPLLWACGREYYYKGRLVLTVKGGNIFDSPILVITDAGESLNLQPVDLNHLFETNRDSLYLLEYEALKFINEIYRNHKAVASNPKSVDFDLLAKKISDKEDCEYTVVKEDCDSFDVMPMTEAKDTGKKVVYNSKIQKFISSFSGGKDSQVVLDLVSRVVPPDDFIVTYSDTGYELPPSIKLYLETKRFYEMRKPGLKFYMFQNHQDIMYYWNHIGAPSRMHRWCCGVMKTAPLYRNLKEIMGLDKQPNVLAFEGVRAEESNTRSQYNRVGVAVKHQNVVNARPIFSWNNTEVYLYILNHKLPFNDGYRQGLARVGCSLCPYSSDWSEMIVGKVYRESVEPFLKHIAQRSELLGIDSDEKKAVYIKEGNWKLRAGGKTSDAGNSRLDVITTNPDLKVVLTEPKEEIFTWLRVLGPYQTEETSEGTLGYIKYKGNNYRFLLQSKEDGKILTVTFFNVGKEIVFQGHIKRALYKTVYCIHCEACEVECPTGALTVVPKASVNANKCVHCLKCIEFKDRGCVMANSMNISEGNLTNKNKMKTSGIDKYSTFGLKVWWLERFFESPDTYFEGDHGLGVKMVPAAINWYRDAEIMDRKDKVISPLGRFLADKYNQDHKSVWEIMWINMYYNSLAVQFYIDNIVFGRPYEKKEILTLMADEFPGTAEATLNNPLGALCSMFGINEMSCLGDEMGQGFIEAKGKSVKSITRTTDPFIKPAVIAYFLYRYAEAHGRYSLRVSELFDRNNRGSIEKVFGISRSDFENALRSLSSLENGYVSADLLMGLDNINLKEGATALEVLETLL